MQHINREYVEITYIEGACGVSGWDGENNESKYEQFDISVKEKGVNCGVEERVKRGALGWFEHMMRRGRMNM